jgi:hypothetical protein
MLRNAQYAHCDVFDTSFEKRKHKTLKTTSIYTINTTIHNLLQRTVLYLVHALHVIQALGAVAFGDELLSQPILVGLRLLTLLLGGI